MGTQSTWGFLFWSSIKMPFDRFVEIGRVAYVAFGADKGKLVVIVDVIDQNRALVDGPCSGVSRKDMNFKAMHLTPLKVDIHHSASWHCEESMGSCRNHKNGMRVPGPRN